MWLFSHFHRWRFKRWKFFKQARFSKELHVLQVYKKVHKIKGSGRCLGIKAIVQPCRNQSTVYRNFRSSSRDWEYRDDPGRLGVSNGGSSMWEWQRPQSLTAKTSTTKRPFWTNCLSASTVRTDSISTKLSKMRNN